MAQGRTLAGRLGWGSLGLGAVQLVAPARILRLIGVRDSPRTRRIMRMVGVQEVTAGLGLVARPPRASGVGIRIAGDCLHLGLLAAAARHPDHRPARVTGAIAVVAGITLLDLWAALRLARPRRPGQGVLRARATITVNRPPREVYRFWRELENLPRFMYHLRTVRDLGGGRSYWVARAPGSREVTWHAEIVAEVPERLLAWRSLPGARVRNAGMVTFTPAPRGSGTEVTVELGFQPPFGRLGAAVAALFGEEPHQQVRDDLRRFKQRLETGEIVRSDGSPEGTMVRQQARQRAAQPMG